jgi:hypothetical protein
MSKAYKIIIKIIITKTHDFYSSWMVWAISSGKGIVKWERDEGRDIEDMVREGGTVAFQSKRKFLFLNVNNNYMYG